MIGRESPAEQLRRDMRDYLALAHRFEREGELPLADACGALAAIKLSRSIRLDEQADRVAEIQRQETR